MPKLLAAIVAIAATGAIATASALPKTIDYDAETRAIARDFIDILFVQKDVTRAFERYATPNFIQHDPEIPNGVNGVSEFLNARHARNPQQVRPVSEWRNEITHVLVQHKMFAVHQVVYTNSTDPGRVFFNIFRVENGRIVEHWDVVQAVSESALNGNTMYRDMVPSRPRSQNAPAPEAVIREYIRMSAEDGAVPAMERYLAPNVVQHTPNIPDGKAAAIEFFRARDNRQRTPGEIAQRITGIVRMISDGDLVLAHRHVSRPTGPSEMSVDLWRVQDGLIVEHWGAIQAVPPVTVENTTMW